MILSLVVTFCHLAMSSPVAEHDVVTEETCHEEVIAEGDLPLQACAVLPDVVDWKAHSRFAGPQWRLARWRCVLGHYVVKDAI